MLEPAYHRFSSTEVKAIVIQFCIATLDIAVNFALNVFMIRCILTYHLIALLVLTSIGIPIFTHVCNGQGMSWSSVLLPAKSCCSKKKAGAKACHGITKMGCKKGINSKPCCENHTDWAQMESAFLANFEDWPVKKLEIISPAIPAILLPVNFSSFYTTYFSFQPHAPPLQRHGRSLLIFEQTFLC